MRTKIFTYKGVIGAETDLDNGKFLNSPKDGGQLGCVIDTKEIDITKEAKELIKSAPKEGGSFAPIMLTKHSDGSGSSVGLMGFWKHLFAGDELCIGRTCETSVLDDCNEIEIEIPEEFKKVVDANF
ncbi:MAG: hypothetical protein WC428_02045 [Candidatus Paceibacterota bacterium]|jgi:hypothetical protein